MDKPKKDKEGEGVLLSRRDALGILGGGLALMAGPACNQPDPAVQPLAQSVRALVFDAYGTLYNVQAVSALAEQLVPGRGEVITQVWRLKQLEYTWLGSLMKGYEDFWAMTRYSLEYALSAVGVEPTTQLVDQLRNRYLTLDPYPEAVEALQQLRQRGLKLAILSNGSPNMLEAAAQASGLDRLLDRNISVELVQVYKPDPRVYALAPSQLGIPANQILFVSSNNFDIIGAKNAGLRSVWIRRAIPNPPPVGSPVSPSVLFSMLRGRREEIGLDSDYTVNLLTDLPALVDSL
jgi:2-haloacid dehalogenase